jgi:hypothetical protein
MELKDVARFVCRGNVVQRSGGRNTFCLKDIRVF